MSTVKAYDNLNRLTSVTTTNTLPAVLDSHVYGYNSANQRTSMTNADGAYWAYQYDTLGQLTSGIKYWSDGTAVAGQQFGYAFDSIGNRQSTSAGGDQNSANLRAATYSANNLNQYTSRTVPNAVDVTGSATNAATVTVNGQTTYRKNDYYWLQLGINNSVGPVFQPVTNLAVLNQRSYALLSNTTGNIYVPQTPENFSYDADGNLTADGRWNYTWDAENRLVSMQALANVPLAAKLKLDFAYDYMGRRIQKVLSTNNGTVYLPQNTNFFAYDGWNVIAVLSAQSSLLQSLLWGLDLSGTQAGAGGVGGVLGIGDAANGVNFAVSDANGNLTALVNSTNGIVSANYEYGPFGEVIRATGPAAKANHFRFSTKYQDDETDFLYYGYRYYNPGEGRWLSTDPAEEIGGLNLYGFAGESPQNAVDALGMDIVVGCPQDYFKSLGLVENQDYESVGPNQWRAKSKTVKYADNLDKEIVWDMLSTGSDRVFNVKNSDVKQLQQHIIARKNVINAISGVHWTFGDDKLNVWNHAFWLRPLVVKEGVNYATAVNDPFSSHSDFYVSGCNATSLLIELKGMLDTIGATQFQNQMMGTGSLGIEGAAQQANLLKVDNVNPGGESPTLRDWVPGDRGYIKGGIGGNQLNSGEWIIYMGGNQFWGFDRPPHQTDLTGMMNAVKGFSGGSATETGQRWYPRVGLK